MLKYDPKDEAEALAQCEAEPIRTPDCIQPHGCLIVCPQDLGPITHISANATDYFKQEAADLLDVSLEELLSRVDVHTIRNVTTVAMRTKQREFLGRLTLPGQDVFAALHVRDDRLILEVSSMPDELSMDQQGIDRLRWLMSRPNHDTEFNAVMEALVHDLRAVVEFDRVMAYRFRPDGSGEVIAESCRADLESYVGLRFPSQDIPQIARAINLEQPIRVMPDVSAAQVPILSKPDQTVPLDLTVAELRGTSEVHRAYLKNMGVSASLVFPVVIGGKLWGMFSCQHTTPKSLNTQETILFELVGQILSVGVKEARLREMRQLRSEADEMTRVLTQAQQASATDLFSVESWGEFSTKLMVKLSAQGVLLVEGDKRQEAGLIPESATLAIFEKHIIPADLTGIYSNDCLKATVPESDEIAGAMRIDIDPEQETVLWLFRREENQTVNWAGAPDKEIEKTGATTRLHPRSSFEAYSRMSEGSSRAWEVDDTQMADALRDALHRVLVNFRERDEYAANLNIMVQELNHRVRNILSVILSLVRRTADGTVSLSEYRKALESRIFALSNAHDLLNDSNGRGLDLKRLIERELEPFAASRRSLHGPTIRLKASAATNFVLVVHEIVTNAVKYGALSSEHGSVLVNWSLRDGALHFIWKEVGGPPVIAPKEDGFGQYLIKQACGHQLKGGAKIAFPEGGVEITLEVSDSFLEKPVKKPSQAKALADDLPAKLTKPKTIDLDRVLVLEDSLMVASEIASFSTQEGAKNVLCAGNNPEALKIIAEKEPSFAILDVDLGDDDSYATANYLRATGVAFVFLTGFSHKFNWLSEFPDVPLVNKPLRHDHLRAAMSKAVEAQG